MRTLLLPAFAILTLAHAQAQAHPSCPARPQTLMQMRGCYRPLLVFTPTPTDARLIQQRQALDSAADDMMDRNVLLVPVTQAGSSFDAPLDAPYALLPAPEAGTLRKHYAIASGSFEVLLLGEDGGVKLRSSTPVSVDRLNSLIDSMPTRKLEMQRPHTN